MPNVSQEAAIKFCELCNWAYESWVTHKCLFDANATPDNNIGRSPYFTQRLAIITQEYALHQIAKLHDPWKQRNSINLTIGYVVECGGWGEHKSQVDQITARLNDLHEAIRPARNKILSHNDLHTAVGNAALGRFAEGDDDSYFDALQDLVDLVHDRWIGGPYPFNDLAVADAHEFLHLLEQPPRHRPRT